MAAKDAAWAEAVQEAAGLQIWRIENFEAVPVPEAYYGRFYDGDCYLVYMGIERPGGIESHIHYWIGKEASQDEYGTVALKAVELDQAMGDRPTQHREVQEHESSLFMSHFANTGGVEYMHGGVASGFNHVEPETYEPRLMQIKGKRNVRVQQVPLAAASLNEGDVFVLDLGMRLFLWCGSSANKYEKFKGTQVLQRLDDARGGEPERFVITSGGEVDEEEAAAFWEALEGDAGDVQPAEAGGDDAFHDVSEGVAKLYRLSDAEGDLTFSPIEFDGQLDRKLLDENDVIVVDAGNSVFTWVGRKASKAEKKNALPYTERFVIDQGKPSWVSATVVRQRMEPAEFKSLFHQWDPPVAFDFTQIHRGSDGAAAGAGADEEEEEFDVSGMVAQGRYVDPAAQRLGGDSGSGTAEVWRVTGNDFTQVPEEQVGQFFAGDCYVIKYTYDGGIAFYFWLGRDADTIEKGYAATRVKELSDQAGGSHPQIRVTQGNEPPHFCAVFDSFIVVHMTGKSDEEVDESQPRLYHVKGQDETTTKAVQVTAAAERLNSGDCFVLLTEGTATVWNGEHSSEAEQALAQRVAEGISGDDREVRTLSEGEEDDAFWEALGGQADYPKASAAVPADHASRLFQVSNQTGRIAVQEVFNFGQDDLLDDDVMILDAYAEVFVWVGRGANGEERSRSSEIAAEYVEQQNDGRGDSVPVIVEHAGSESPLFKAHFAGWSDAQAAEFVDPFEAKLAQIEAEKAARAAAAEQRDAEQSAKRAAAIAALEAKAEEEEEAEPEAEEEEEAQEEAAPAAGGGAADEDGAAAKIRNTADDSDVQERLAAADAERERILAEMAAGHTASKAADDHDKELQERLVAAEAEKARILAEMTGPRKADTQPGDKEFSLEELQAAEDGAALGIDFAKRHLYLSDAAFSSTFGMDKEAFEAQAKWKRDKARKAKGLF